MQVEQSTIWLLEFMSPVIHQPELKRRLQEQEQECLAAKRA